MKKKVLVWAMLLVTLPVSCQQFFSQTYSGTYQSSYPVNWSYSVTLSTNVPIIQNPDQSYYYRGSQLDISYSLSGNF
jgi:hypothetical protein